MALLSKKRDTGRNVNACCITETGASTSPPLLKLWLALVVPCRCARVTRLLDASADTQY